MKPADQHVDRAADLTASLIKIKEIVRRHFPGDPDAFDPTAVDADASSAVTCCSEYLEWLEAAPHLVALPELFGAQVLTAAQLEAIEIRKIWDECPRPLEFARAVEQRTRETVAAALRANVSPDTAWDGADSAAPDTTFALTAISDLAESRIGGRALIQQIDEDGSHRPVYSLTKLGHALLYQLLQIQRIQRGD